MREFLPAMVENNYGHVVTIASMAAKTGVAYLTDYSLVYLFPVLATVRDHTVLFIY